LQRLTEHDGFQRPIPGRNGIETHNATAMRGASGVSKTRSARAVR
jgi:hypothetical protein